MIPLVLFLAIKKELTSAKQEEQEQEWCWLYYLEPFPSNFTSFFTNSKSKYSILFANLNNIEDWKFGSFVKDKLLSFELGILVPRRTMQSLKLHELHSHQDKMPVSLQTEGKVITDLNNLQVSKGFLFFYLKSGFFLGLDQFLCKLSEEIQGLLCSMR